MLERTDRLLVVLIELEPRRDNQRPQPDRSRDPFTPREPDYERAYYEDLVFGRMRRYFEAQSGDRFSISGHVTDWVTPPAGSPSGAGLAVAAVNAWIARQIEAGRTLEVAKPSSQPSTRPNHVLERESLVEYASALGEGGGD